MATKRRKKLVEILHDAKLGETTAKQLTRVATSEYTPIHPIFKRVLGNMFLAAAHPGGFGEGMKTQVFLEMMGKILPWLMKERGRAVHIANNGRDINFMFTEGGKECRGPL